MENEKEERQRRKILEHERQILIRLFYILEKKQLISVEERNLALKYVKAGTTVEC